MIKPLATKKFTCHLNREHSSRPTMEPLGEFLNEMRLYEGKNQLFIEWEAWSKPDEYGKHGGDEFETISIWTAGKKVTEYDGVFDIPKEAIEMVEEYGLDCTEIKRET